MNNYRIPRFFKIDGVESRDLYKLYGVRIEVVTQGIGRKYEQLFLLEYLH